MAGEGHAVQVAARVLAVSESGYYAWRTRGPSQRSIRHVLLTDAIRQIHATSNGIYGARRVHAELVLGRGLRVWHGTVEMLMARDGLQGIGGRPKWRRPRPELISSDLVDRQFRREGLDQLWVTDITEHPTREGKVYCAVVLDVCARRVVGWAIDSSPTAVLVTNALGMAIDARRPPAGAVIHSDHGVQGGFQGLHPPRPRLRARAVHGFDRRLLRQRGHRELLVPHAGRATQPTPLAHPPGVGERDLRVPRDLPQPPASTLGHRLADA